MSACLGKWVSRGALAVHVEAQSSDAQNPLKARYGSTHLTNIPTVRWRQGRKSPEAHRPADGLCSSKHKRSCLNRMDYEDP